MKSYYVPYSGKSPVAMSVNGHKLLILSNDKEVLTDSLDLLGADRVRKIVGGSTKADQEKVLSKIARSINADLVIAPREVGIGEVIRNLESQLPWIQ